MLNFHVPEVPQARKLPLARLGPRRARTKHGDALPRAFRCTAFDSSSAHLEFEVTKARGSAGARLALKCTARVASADAATVALVAPAPVERWAQWTFSSSFSSSEGFVQRRGPYRLVERGRLRPQARLLVHLTLRSLPQAKLTFGEK